MKRVYKLVITNDDFHQEIVLNSVREIESSRVSKVSLSIGEDAFFELYMFCTGSNCTISTNSDEMLQDKNGIIGKDVNLRCGDILKVLNPTGKHVLYQCEMTLAASLNDDGTLLPYDFGFSLQDDLIIGGSENATVKVDDPLLGEDYITLAYRDGRFFIERFKSKYGLFLNGTRIYKMCEIRNYSFIVIDGVHFYLKDGVLFTDSSYKIALPVGMKTFDVKSSASHLHYPKFNRSTRMQTVLSDQLIEVLDAPAAPQESKTNLILSLLPSVVMLAAVLIASSFSGSSGGSFIILSACMMGVGVLTSVISFVEGKRNYKKAVAERERGYKDYIDRKRAEIKDARDSERVQLEEIYHNLQRDIEAVGQFNAELFDRRVDDADFLETYIGQGSRPAVRQVSFKRREQIKLADDLAVLPEQLRDEFRFVTQAPIVLNLAQDNAVGFIGTNSRLYTQMQNITLDICVRQYYRDVKLFFIINPDFTDRVMWLRWLPHVQNDELGVRNIVCSEESQTELLEYLYVLMNQREQNKKVLPHIVVFILNDIGIKSHPVSQYFSHSRDDGVTFLFFENSAELLPEYCDEVVSLDGDNSGVLTFRADKNVKIPFSFTTIDDSAANLIALKLAPVYCEEVGLANSLVKSFTFYEMLGITEADDVDLAENWRKSDATKSLAVPIGINAKNEIVYLDLHESAHGPHGLVAGTTGSGKSELLQTYILSMATHFNPYEVGFMIIDFKGGGMANQLAGLPHLIGTITNIDGTEINRSLLSLRAELEKRQRLFAENKVNKIDEYIRKFKSGQVTEALPHLIIIVDEFAELKANQPDFMKELISASRIGRSLGIHLILATQKPAGQVNDQIWSNSRFKLCLKVQSQSDSNEVIKSPLAAEIREPGRAYLQIGNNEIFELFQSGYSGGSSENTQEARASGFELYEIDMSGRRTAIFKQKKSDDAGENSTGSRITQLMAIIAQIKQYCSRNNIPALPSIIAPALPARLELDTLIEQYQPESSMKMGICLGLLDDPTGQQQLPLWLDMQELKSLLIVGEQGNGKSTLLQTMMLSLSGQYAPEQVNFYVLDFSSGILKQFRPLPHCGVVLCEEDTDSIDAFFELLRSILEDRKKLFQQLDVSNYEMANAVQPLPLILVMIDNIAGMGNTKAGDAHLYKLSEYIKNGSNYGIKYIVTGSHLNDASQRIKQELGNRICLYLSDRYDYGAALGCRCQLQPPEMPGRGVYSLDGVPMEMQLAMAETGLSGKNRADRVGERVREICKKYAGHTVAKPLPQVNEDEDYDVFATRFAPGRIPLGYDITNGKPIALPFRQAAMLEIYFGNSRGVRPVLANLLMIAGQNGMAVTVLRGIEKSCFKEQEPAVEQMLECNTESLAQLWQNLTADLIARKKLRKEYCAASGTPDTPQATFAYMSQNTRAKLLVIENFAEFCKTCDESARMVFPEIFNIAKLCNFYVLGCFYPDDLGLAGNKVFLSFNEEASILLFGGQHAKQALTSVPRDYAQRDMDERYNRFLMRYHNVFHTLVMPCGDQVVPQLEEDDMDIFG